MSTDTGHLNDRNGPTDLVYKRTKYMNKTTIWYLNVFPKGRIVAGSGGSVKVK